MKTELEIIDAILKLQDKFETEKDERVLFRLSIINSTLLYVLGYNPLNEEERKVVTFLQEKGSVHIDQLNMHSGLSNSAVAAAILSMELEGMIQSLPGKLYKLI